MTSLIKPGTSCAVELEMAVRRVKADFLEMPGLQLNVSQACRLFGLDLETCRATLQRLVDARFLAQNGKAQFSRA